MVRMAVPVRDTRGGRARTGEPDSGEMLDERDAVEEPGGRWPAAGTIRSQWTATDLDNLPDDGLRYEIVDGTLLVSPAPTPFHQRASRRLQRLLEGACPEGFEVFDAPVDWRPDGTTSLQPDLLVVRTADVTRDRLLGTPLVVVEVLSPSSVRVDRTVKRDRYAEAGVAQYWIVDPGAADRFATVEVYDLAENADGTSDYVMQVRAAGEEEMRASLPPAAFGADAVVAVTPAGLVS